MKVAPKHEQLQDEDNAEVKISENKYVKNIASPFINQQKAWDDENDFQISPELIRGITEELGFIKPSRV